MLNLIKRILLYSIFFVLFLSSCNSNQSDKTAAGIDNKEILQYKKWIVGEPVFEKGPKGSFDEIAVKDPSIVFYNNKYHMFYTSIAGAELRKTSPYAGKNGAGLGYVSAESIDQLGTEKRHNICEIAGSIVIAPQVFYFVPQKLWYIIAQTPVEGNPNLQPVFMTNPDIENVNGWSKPEILKTGKINNGFWIDFWIICDDNKAHLFYTDHEGSLFRFECPVQEFPSGFANQKEETVLTDRGENKTGRWRLHEASHIYYVKSCNKYLNIVESVYPHPTRKNYWESRNRFLFAYTSDKLEGPWKRVENDANGFFGDPANLFLPDGMKPDMDQVSHPELIRAGYDQKLEINDLDLQLLFQSFDADTINSDYDYSYLPWELRVMKNYNFR